jgi:cytochrome P450
MMTRMAPEDSGLPPRFDPGDPAVIEDPYPAYARLRSAGPLCRFGPGQWGVTRHAEVTALLRDRRLGSGFPPDFYRYAVGEGPASAFFEQICLVRDPPEHTRLRRLMGRALGQTSIRGLRDRMEERVDELLAPALDSGRLEAVADLAYPLPVTVICELLGVPSADRDLVRPRADGLVKGFTTFVGPEDRAEVHESVRWLQDYVGRLLEERRRRPGNDLLSLLAAAEDDGQALAREEIVDNAVFLFFAGFETTKNLIANACAALLRYPDQLARLRRDRSLVPAAVEEFLRYDAPVQGAGRYTREPVEIGGRTIRRGRVLVLLIGSANRDERQFSDPEALDVGRRPNPHLAFGGGGHLCLGAPLARAEGAVVLERLLDRFATFEPAGDPVRRPLGNFRTYASVPIAVSAA